MGSDLRHGRVKVEGDEDAMIVGISGLKFDEQIAVNPRIGLRESKQKNTVLCRPMSTESLLKYNLCHPLKKREGNENNLELTTYGKKQKNS